jgi:hypothetical protein
VGLRTVPSLKEAGLLLNIGYADNVGGAGLVSW